MHSTIYDGSTIESRAALVHEKYLATQIELFHLTAEKSSLTIKQVHELGDSLTTHPRLPRIVWIEEANLLTLPAQNALLKLLEEPPIDTVFILTCQNSGSLLATIRSRSHIIHLGPGSSLVSAETLALIKSALSSTSGDRLVLADSLPKTRLEALAWMNSLLQSLAVKIEAGEGSANSRKLLGDIGDLALQTAAQLSANCNVTLALRNLFLHLPRSV